LTGSKPTILYIEDDPASRRLVERTLNDAGYSVMLAERGLDGIDLARRVNPDLILTDINLPDLNGQEIAITLRREIRFSRTPIVAVTAQSHTRDREIALAAGINGYITKPLDVEQLPVQIAYYLGGGSDLLEADRMSSAQTMYTQDVVSRLEARIRELEKANRELRELDQMRNTFIELTAHELRTPLTLVYGYSRLLEDHPPLQQMMGRDETIRALIQGMGEAINRMQGIIQEIMTISRIMTDQIDLSISPVSLSAVIRRAIRNYDEAVRGRRIIVHFTPDSDEWPRQMQGDVELLYLMFTNLVSNAIKYTPDGGDVFISAKTDAQWARVVIRDTGIGIDKAEQKKIFERFHTSDDLSHHSTSKTAFKGGGLGLGLAIARGIAQAHGGQIWVESLGRDPVQRPGSTFTILLPLKPVRRTQHPLVSMRSAADDAPSASKQAEQKNTLPNNDFPAASRPQHMIGDEGDTRPAQSETDEGSAQ
jgi:signal transduction histidine kinase